MGDRRRAVTVSPRVLEIPTYIVPTGFSGVPPDGPAIPVVEIPISVPNASRTPRAISLALEEILRVSDKKDVNL